MDSNQGGVASVSSPPSVDGSWTCRERPTALVAIAAGCEGPLNPFCRKTCLPLRRLRHSFGEPQESGHLELSTSARKFKGKKGQIAEPSTAIRRLPCEATGGVAVSGT
jgi:hypothetical protein